MSQFGQPPLAALLPLKAGQNLADLPDKAAALVNLGTLSSSDIMMNAVPIGTIIAFWGATAPTGYLPCNGQTVNSGTFPDLVTFLGGGSSQALPDLRGEFLRGWDNGRGVDVGRALKTLQLDQFQGHYHGLAPGNTQVIGIGTTGTGTQQVTAGSGNQGYLNVGPPITDGTNGTPRTGAETRPRNVAVQYCMKAYGALVNTATANIGNVLTELSQTVKVTQFESNLSANGYQKISGGAVLQWGTTTSIPAVTSYAVVFPIAFPNSCASVMITPSTTGTSQAQSTVSAKTATGFTMSNSASVASTYNWMAIGY